MTRSSAPSAGWPVSPQQLEPMAEMFRRNVVCEHRLARRLARQADIAISLLDWGQKYLPRHFSKPPSTMHRWLAEQIERAQAARGCKINVLGPRGGAKSTIGALALPLRAALERRDPYIWIVSDTAHQACAHLDNVKAELVDNPRLANDYPTAVGLGPTWRHSLIVLRNGVTIEALGTGQRIRGRRRGEHRPSLIICDDLQNDGHIRSALQREHSRTWFHGALINAGTPHTNVVNLATALHHQAIAMELHRTSGWSSRIFQSIVRWPENMSLWNQWEAIVTDLSNPNYKSAAEQFYQQHRQAMHAGAVVLWPQVEGLDVLMRHRAESGHAAFEREKQNSPVNPDVCEWPESYFDETVWFETWPSSLPLKTMALDPSKGADARRGDYSALVVLGVDRHGVLFVEADLARRPVPDIVAQGVEWFRRFQPDAFAVEANQFQDLLASHFEMEFRRQGILTARPVPIENHTAKQVRIRRLVPYLSSRRVRFKSNSPSTRLLVEQLREFPIADHDDGPDALEMAIRLAEQVFDGRSFNDGLGNRLPVG